MKAQIRSRLKPLREAQSPQLKAQSDKKILLRLQKLPAFKNSREFFTYLSHKGEVSTDHIIQKFFNKKKIIVPKLKRRAICLYELAHPTLYSKGKFGIREPLHCLPKKQWKEIDAAIIPGIAFDKTGHRIGFGGGYFDRFLKKLHCTTIGLAYEFQMVDKVPAGPYDVPVDFIITEQRLIRCHSYRNKIRRSTKSSRVKRVGKRRGLS